MHSDVQVLLALYYATLRGEKAVKAKAKQFLKGTPQIVKEAIVFPILDSKTPLTVAQVLIDRYCELTIAARDIYKMGAVGMVLFNHEAIPYFRVVNETDDEMDAWFKENEELNLYMAREGLKRLLCATKVDCDVLLFSNSGFSGTVFKMADGFESQRIHDYFKEKGLHESPYELCAA